MNLVSLVEILRNNPFGFIEEHRGRIQAYYCRSGSLTYRRLPLSIRIRRLAQSPAGAKISRGAPSCEMMPDRILHFGIQKAVKQRHEESL